MLISKSSITKICLSSLFLSLGIVLPFLTGQIPEIGSMLCPMHIPILICGIVCGWKYGIIVGFITPLLRSLTLSMPPLYPEAFAMAFELAAYGFFSGIFYNIFKKKNNGLYIYLVIILSMLLGRIIWGSIRFIMAFIDNSLIFNFRLFIIGGFVSAWPGIILHIIIIPAIIITLRKSHLLD